MNARTNKHMVNVLWTVHARKEKKKKKFMLPPPLLSSLSRGFVPLRVPQAPPKSMYPKFSCTGLRNEYQQCLDLNLFKHKSLPCSINFPETETCYAKEHEYALPTKEFQHALKDTLAMMRTRNKNVKPSSNEILSNTRILDFPQNLKSLYEERYDLYYTLVHRVKRIETYFNKKRNIQPPRQSLRRAKELLFSLRQKIYQHLVTYNIRKVQNRGLGEMILLIRDTSKMEKQTQQMRNVLEEIEDWENKNGMHYEYLTEGIA
jgi:hypothetical protein